jgi:hypothetical protein
MSGVRVRLSFVAIVVKLTVVYCEECLSPKCHEKWDPGVPERNTNRPCMLMKQGEFLVLDRQTFKVFLLCRMDEQEWSLR